MTALHKKESVYRPALFLLGTEPHDLTFFPEAPSLKGPVTSIPPQWGSSFCYRKLWGTYPNSIADLDSPRAGNEPACVTEWSLDPSIRPGPMQRGRLASSQSTLDLRCCWSPWSHAESYTGLSVRMESMAADGALGFFPVAQCEGWPFFSLRAPSRQPLRPGCPGLLAVSAPGAEVSLLV